MWMMWQSSLVWIKINCRRSKISLRLTFASTLRQVSSTQFGVRTLTSSKCSNLSWATAAAFHVTTNFTHMPFKEFMCCPLIKQVGQHSPTPIRTERVAVEPSKWSNPHHLNVVLHADVSLDYVPSCILGKKTDWQKLEPSYGRVMRMLMAGIALPIGQYEQTKRAQRTWHVWSWQIIWKSIAPTLVVAWMGRWIQAPWMELFSM